MCKLLKCPMGMGYLETFDVNMWNATAMLQEPGCDFLNAWDLVIPTGLKFSLFNKLHIFQSIGNSRYVLFQRLHVLVKFHTKYSIGRL